MDLDDSMGNFTPNSLFDYTVARNEVQYDTYEVHHAGR